MNEQDYLDEIQVWRNQNKHLLQRVKDLTNDLAAARELLIDVMSSLAAAISLLERGGKQAKKAAPSDKMFDQMLVDYLNSLEHGRAALAAKDTL